MDGNIKVLLMICMVIIAISSVSDARGLMPGKTSHLINHHQRIIGGWVAEPHSFPYIVYITITFPCNNYVCGGTIINKRTVVTAAHCLESVDPKNYTIFAGAHNISGILKGVIDHHIPPQPPQVVKAQRVIPHPKYTRIDYDLGIIHLSKDLKFNEYVKPMKLPQQGQKFPDNSIATVSGWGDLDWHETEAELLHYNRLITMDRKKCQQIYEQFNGLKRPPTWMDDKLCAGPPGKGAGHGDSGGPMVINGVLAGVTSFGLGHEKSPSYFAKVSHLADWIEKNKYPAQVVKSGPILHL